MRTETNRINSDGSGLVEFKLNRKIHSPDSRTLSVVWAARDDTRGDHSQGEKETSK